MKKMMRIFLAVGFVVSPVLAVLLMTGCDEMPRTGFDLEPSYVELTPGSNIVTITVATNSQTQLSLPLTWRVSDPALGTIIPRQGFEAQYIRSGQGGLNTIFATDQAGFEGYTTVRQISEQYVLVITANPTSIPDAANALVTLTVAPKDSSGSVALPYDWSVTNPSDGVIEGGNGNATVVFRSKNNKPVTILVRDGNGVTAALGLMPAASAP
jgi:hypothetical protein